MLQLRIKSLLLSKGIDKPYPYLRKLGISHHSIHKLLNTKSLRIPIQLISKICAATYCTPNDIFEWVPQPGEAAITAVHPLHKLQSRAAANILDKLSKMTEAEILEWEKRMDE